MVNDYRNTEYCPSLDNIKMEKKAIVSSIKERYPKMEDVHAYVSKNRGENNIYKLQFIEAYNFKCSYCGYGGEDIVVDKWLFEIDHYICKTSGKFSCNKDSGAIENLVLACKDCNNKKSGFEITDEYYNELHPDIAIRNTFERDDKFYIRITENFKDNIYIKKFYDKLRFGEQIHRLDYLVMSMVGLQKNNKDKVIVYNKLDEMIKLLKNKRNCFY